MLHWAKDLGDMEQTLCGTRVFVVLEQGDDVTCVLKGETRRTSLDRFIHKERTACRDCVFYATQE